MKNDLKYILLTFILLVGTLTAGAVGLAATGRGQACRAGGFRDAAGGMGG